MKIPRSGREFANWSVAGAPPSAVFQAKLTYPDGSESAWLTVETVNQSRIRLLVAGPDADPGDANVLPAGGTSVILRLTDTPELVVRNGGDINVG